jgi:outer membrane protein OmpA-like peptidoglycan-associated protein/opacity protein-like surface antigen
MKRIGLIVLVAALALGTAAPAEDLTGRVGVGVDLGNHKLLGGDHDYSNVDQFGAFHLRYGLSTRLVLDGILKYGTVRPGAYPNEDAGWSQRAVWPYYTTMWQGMLGARYNLAPDSGLKPFASAHVGFMDWKVRDESMNPDKPGMFPSGPVVDGTTNSWDPTKLESMNLTTSLGLGLEYFFSSSVSIEIGARHTWIIDNTIDNIGTSSDDLYGPGYADANQRMFSGMLGLTWYFGGNKDKDGDGFENKHDRCPEEAEDFDGYMDEDGCPDPDNDGDGILDVEDNCPDDAEDFDGYQDEDGCPDPDNDGDGVIDADDQCPDEAEDIDGFEDEDGCPDPDNDGDGVLDAQDKCPDTPTDVEVDEHGCPIVAELKADVILKGVAFSTGKSELTADSAAVLDEVAVSLHAWPEVTIEIQGHTDSSGSADLNKALSLMRAEAVREYLIVHGIDPSRMTSVGYGEDRPIAENSSAEGRRTNRRVELVRTDPGAQGE